MKEKSLLLLDQREYHKIALRLGDLMMLTTEKKGEKGRGTLKLFKRMDRENGKEKEP